METDFDTWLKVGINNGWCSQLVCETHEGLPLLEGETELIDDGLDICMSALRIYPPDIIHG